MALFNKLFFSSSSKRKTLSTTTQSQQYLSQFPFDTKQVRVLLYRECDNRGRRLLFDSNAVQRINEKDVGNLDNIKISTESKDGKFTNPISTPKHNNTTGHTTSSTPSITISEEFSYKHGRPTADITSIGELIFGALAMSFRGTGLKVHWLQSPVRILCSQVFLSPVPTNSSLGRRKLSKDSSGQSLSSDTTSVNSFSMPFSVCIKARHLNQLTDKLQANTLDATPDSDICNSDSSTQRYSVFSVGDSGYGGGGGGGTDIWTASVSSCYQYSTRSSLASIFDDPDSSRKLSIDSSGVGGCGGYGGGGGENSFNTSSTKSSNGNFQRRISRNISTSFENRTSSSDFIGFIGDNCQTVTTGGSDGCVTQYQKSNTAKENRSNPEMIRQRRSSGETTLNINGHNRHFIKRAKLGLAVCITMTEQYEIEMQQFCCEHIALLETMLCRLRVSAENAYLNHRNFLQIMFNAWQITARWIVDLFTAPRLPCPIWLSLESCERKKAKIVADSFVKELCWLLSFADTKDTNFFISKIVTAILTNHLGWVAIISTMKCKINSKSSTSSEGDTTLDDVSQKHPYNALWAQIGDLYGAIGSPRKISRTIVYGKEKGSIERLLKVLTYFIRCGEIKRISKTEIFDKTSLIEILSAKQEKQTILPEKKQTLKSGGLSRSRTCIKNLEEINNCNEDSSNKKMLSMNNIELQRTVMNDIPNVLVFRDSHVVQQELRIGNFLMDTGIERNPIKVSSKKCEEHKNKIRLTLTNPDNIEVPVESIDSDVIAEEPQVLEAIEIESIGSKKASEIKSFSFKDFSWNIEPIKDGLSWEDVRNLQKKIQCINEDSDSNSAQKSKSDVGDIIKSREYSLPSDENLKKYASLSDLITANSVGQSERFTWGIERTKENVCLEEEKHFELSKKMIETEKNVKQGSNEVVFVLGDNEALVNIKKSTENISEISNKTKESTLSSGTHQKKHSSVKFNFDQYPEVRSDYESCEKLPEMNERDQYELNMKNIQALNNSRTSILETNAKNDIFLQAPPKEDSLHEISMTAKKIELVLPIENTIHKFKKETKENLTDRKQKILNIIQLPIPKIENKIKSSSEKGIISGFVPSLLINVSDHYIPDVVLQGTISPPRIWKINLKQDLALASRCASFTSAPTENVAIVADMEKWDVTVLSSQTQSLPHVNNSSGTIGMSQLVSTMLETVQAMNSSGISSFECLSYIESKLQEMYLQSEVLAAFLLATEFCSLNTVTSALNLSANDVPLLLSVASIHSPQVTKKYGVSFR